MTKRGYQYKECESCIFGQCSKRGKIARNCKIRTMIKDAADHDRELNKDRKKKPKRCPRGWHL